MTHDNDDDDDDEDDASSVYTSDSSSCATTDDRMLFETKPRVARRRKKNAPPPPVESAVDSHHAKDEEDDGDDNDEAAAEAPVTPKADDSSSPMKKKNKLKKNKLKKNKKKGASTLAAALATLPPVQPSSNAATKEVFPTKKTKKKAAAAPVVDDGAVVVKKSTDNKKPGANNNNKSSNTEEPSLAAKLDALTREAAAIMTKTTAAAVVSAGSSPTKRKKEKAAPASSGLDRPKESPPVKVRPKVEAVTPPPPAKDAKKPKKEATATVAKRDELTPPSSAEATKKKKKNKATEKPESKSKHAVQNRPHTAPTVRKKKVTLSSDDDDDDSSVENAYLVPIKTPPLTSPAPRAKSKSAFSYSDDDDDSSSDSSDDSSFGRRKRMASRQQKATAKEVDPAKVACTEESHTPDQNVGRREQGNTNADDSDSSSDDGDNAEVQQDVVGARSSPRRTLSGDSTDSEPPFPLDLRPGGRKVSRSLSLGSTDSEPPFSLNLRPGQLTRSISNDTTDSEPPIPLSLRPGGGPPRTMSASSIDSEPPLSLGRRPGAPGRTLSNSSSSDSEPPFQLGLRPGATIEQQKNFVNNRPGDRAGGNIVRPPSKTFSAESTDSEPPISLGLRPGAPALRKTPVPADDLRDRAAVGNTILRPPSKTFSADSTDSEPPISLGLRPGAPAPRKTSVPADELPDWATAGHPILRPPPKTFSAESTDSEPPFSLSLRPGAPTSRKASGPDDELPDWACAGHTILRSPSKTVSTESTDSESPFSLNLRPGACPINSASAPAEEFPTDHIPAELDPTYGPDFGARPFQSKGKVIVPCPSYVPTCQDPADVAKYLGRELFHTEAKHSETVSFKDESESCGEADNQVLDDLAFKYANAKIGICSATTGKPQRRASLGSICTGRAIGSLYHGVQESVCGNPSQRLNESNPHFATDVKLRHVVADTKPKKKKRSNRRVSFLFKDLQRFAKKAAKEIQSDDEGVSDDGASEDEDVTDDADGGDEFHGDQSLNLTDAMDHSQTSAQGADFHQSAPVTARHTTVGGATIVDDPITPRFEEIRRKFLRDENGGGLSQGRRHSSIGTSEGHGSESQSRRLSAFAPSSPGLGVFQNDDSQRSNEVENRREAVTSDQRQVSDNAPSASLSNVVSLKDRIKRLSLDDGKGQVMAEERTPSEPTIPQKSRHDAQRSDVVEDSRDAVATDQRKFPDRAPSASLSNVVSLKDRMKRLALDDGKGQTKAEERTPSEPTIPQKGRDHIKPANDNATSSIKALLSPCLTSKPSINRPYGAQTANVRVHQVQAKAGKSCFNQSMGNIQSDWFSTDSASSGKPVRAEQAAFGHQNKKDLDVDKNHDSLENLRAMAEALQQEIDQADNDNDNDPSCSNSSDDHETSDNDDQFNASSSGMKAGAGLGQFVSANKPKLSLTDDDDKSTLSYDVQDVLTSFSQQRKLAMQRARAEKPGGGGKLGDRLKFLQSS